MPLSAEQIRHRSCLQLIPPKMRHQSLAAMIAHKSNHGTKREHDSVSMNAIIVWIDIHLKVLVLGVYFKIIKTLELYESFF